MSRQKNLIFSVVLLLLILGAAELSSYLAVTWVLPKYSLYYAPNDVPTFKTISANWHPVLGWPNPAELRPPHRDATGARMNPGFPASEPNCVSVYGESVVYDYGMRDDDAWTNTLSARLGCRVANFGVPSFGVDQALLRFRDNELDQAEVVVLGFSSAALPRSVNQFRALLPFAGRERERAGLKPRFQVAATGGAEARLQFVPLPLQPLTEAGYAELVAHPENVLAAEAFALNGPDGLIRPGAPYLVTLASGLARLAKRRLANQEPWWADFYRPDHPAEAVRVTTAVLSAFSQEVQSLGRVPLVLIFPTAADLRAVTAGRPWFYQPLLSELDDANINYINFGETLIDTVNPQNVCALFDSDCVSHLSAAGSALVAERLHAHLQTEAPR